MLSAVERDLLGDLRRIRTSNRIMTYNADGIELFSLVIKAFIMLLQVRKILTIPPEIQA